jgi:hypothetical protein
LPIFYSRYIWLPNHSFVFLVSLLAIKILIFHLCIGCQNNISVHTSVKSLTWLPNIINNDIMTNQTLSIVVFNQSIQEFFLFHFLKSQPVQVCSNIKKNDFKSIEKLIYLINKCTDIILQILWLTIPFFTKW